MEKKTIENKYPEVFLQHFLMMFNADINEEEFESHISLAHHMEGLDYLKDLKEEIELIIKNGDQSYFVSMMKENDYENFDEKWIIFILNATSKFIAEQN